MNFFPQLLHFTVILKGTLSGLTNSFRGHTVAVVTELFVSLLHQIPLPAPLKSPYILNWPREQPSGAA